MYIGNYFTTKNLKRIFSETIEEKRTGYNGYWGKCKPNKDYENPDVIKYIEDEFNTNINNIKNSLISNITYNLKEKGEVAYNKETETLYIVNCKKIITNQLKIYMHCVVRLLYMNDYTKNRQNKICQLLNDLFEV